VKLLNIILMCEVIVIGPRNAPKTITHSEHISTDLNFHQKLKNTADLFAYNHR